MARTLLKNTNTFSKPSRRQKMHLVIYQDFTASKKFLCATEKESLSLRSYASSFTKGGVNRRLISPVGKVPFYRAGGLGSILGRTNTQGLKIIEEKVLPLL